MTSNLIRNVICDPKPPRIRSGNDVYVVKEAQNYHRAIILKVKPEINQCKCFLIDVGEVKWFEHKQIFRCAREYREMLPMAMQFSLYGLIVFKDDRNVNEIVVQELANKQLWARIKMKPKDFYKGKGKHQVIPIVLYDSLDKQSRVNISALIINKMVATFKPPKLSKSQTNYVTITHISKTSGLIYCHINNSLNELKFVNLMIESLVEDGVDRCYVDIQSETELHELLTINADNMYLIYFEYDRTWYRAKIVQLEMDSSDSGEKNICRTSRVHCFFVDYGHTRVVKLKNVYSLSGILAHYPQLAVTMALDGVHMTNTKIDRLKSLLFPGDDVFVDVVETMDNGGKSGCAKTMAFAKVTKLGKDMASGETRTTEINRLLR